MKTSIMADDYMEQGLASEKKSRRPAKPATPLVELVMEQIGPASSLAPRPVGRKPR